MDGQFKKSARVNFPQAVLSEYQRHSPSWSPYSCFLVRSTCRVNSNRKRPADLSPKGMNVVARRPSRLTPNVSPTSTDALPRLALCTDPAQVRDVSVDPLRLRTLPDKQPFFVVVRNPSQIDRLVIVEIMAGDTVIASICGSVRSGQGERRSGSLKRRWVGAGSQCESGLDRRGDRLWRVCRQTRRTAPRGSSRI